MWVCLHSIILLTVEMEAFDFVWYLDGIKYWTWRMHNDDSKKCIEINCEKKPMLIVDQHVLLADNGWQTSPKEH